MKARYDSSRFVIRFDASEGLDTLVDELAMLADGKLVHARACDIQPAVLIEVGDGSEGTEP